MLSNSRLYLSALILLILTSGSVSAQYTVTELKFSQPADSGSDTTHTLQSLVKVQGTGGLHQDGLYLMTHSGDRQDFFEEENRHAIENPWRNDTWRYCSVFSVKTGNSVLMGRNWDNQNVGSIIVSFYEPDNGYSSISFSRAIDMGYPFNIDLEQIKATELGNKLLLAPFYATDGINEHGLTVAVTGVREITHRNSENERLVFVTFLIRKILDQTRTIEEAVTLVEKYVPFDLDKNSLNSHLMVSDSSGESVILEYDQDQWRKTYGNKSWQVLTNKPVCDVPDADLRDRCWRYRSISETLDKTEGDIDWNASMGILQDVAQKGTTWSTVYSSKSKEVHFSVYQEWSAIYNLKLR